MRLAECGKRRFGFDKVNRNEPFEWEQVAGFAKVYGVRHQGYCHLVLATMTVVMFGGVCRYDDASRLAWQNVRFEKDESGFGLNFDKLKNAQHR